MDGKKKRWTIGLLVSGITEQFVISICKGVMHAAKERDVNLVVLPGKYIERDLSKNKEIQYEYQYNTLFSYASQDTLDAVIVAADVIGCFADKQKIGQLLDHYKDLPCVLIASKFPGFASVNSDNYKGILDAMKYLIENKECRKFGMIGGPEDNTDARERKQAFLKILEQYQIPFEKNNFVASDLSKRDKGAVKKFLDQNPDVQAVFCVNDDVAITLYEEMEKRSLVPGEDILVFGYDNSLIASKVSPTLSSIWTNRKKLGEKALQILLQMLEGKEIKSLEIPGEFIMRESIGGKKAHLDVLQNEYHDMIEFYVDYVFYNSKYEESKQMEESRKRFENILELLFQLLETDEDLYEKYKKIIDCAKEIKLEYADVDNLLTVYEEVCNYICYKFKKTEKRYEVRQLFEMIYRKMIRTINYQTGKIQEKEEIDNYRFKLFVSNTMQFEKGDTQSYTKLISDMEFMGIRNAKIHLFEKPLTLLQGEEFVRPGLFYTKAVLEDGVVKAIPEVQQKTEIQKIFQFEHAGQERVSAVCLPLFSNEILYGVFVCDLSKQVFENGEFMVNQLGSAVKMIDLLKTNKNIQEKLEESLSVLKEHNIELDHLSKVDALTGIMNRRGFYAAAEKRLTQMREKETGILFAYIDMNNLKLINDQYGHDEGDFSLMQIGKILSDIVKEKGVLGRIGGDEYACIMESPSEKEEEQFVKCIHKRFEQFNRSSAKLYNLTVSVGTYMALYTDQVSLQEALMRADESLYEAKKYRVKSVAKCLL